MRLLASFTLIAGLSLAMAGQASAQFSMSIGNPYNGGFSIGTPGYGVASGYNSYGVGGYGLPGYGVGSGYNNYGGVGLGGGGYGVASGYSNYRGIGPGGYYNNSLGYSNTGYLAGPGVIGGRYGYNSGYSGISPVGAYPGIRPGYGGYNPVGVRSYTTTQPFRANRFGWLR